MDANIDSSRKPTIAELQKAIAVTRLEVLAQQDDETRAEMVSQLSTGQVLEMLSLENTQAVRPKIVNEEVERRLYEKPLTLAELLALDKHDRLAKLITLDKKSRVELLNNMPLQVYSDLLAVEMVEGLNLNVLVSHARESMPTVEELLSRKPRTRTAMLLVQGKMIQILLLAQLPAQAKAEMLLQKFQDAFNLCVEKALDSRVDPEEPKTSKPEPGRTEPSEELLSMLLPSNIPTVDEMLARTPAARIAALGPLNDEMRVRLIAAMPGEEALEMAKYTLAEMLAYAAYKKRFPNGLGTGNIFQA